ncbi:MAG: MgtC/SapB family protein, partial [Hyphomicrobiaceae bacterium]
MPSLDHSITTWIVAIGIGLLIGAERERSKGTGPNREPAGIRTFTIAALFGGAALHTGGENLLSIATAGVLVL